MVPKTERFEMRFDEGTLARIDDWRSKQDNLPSRAEAIRRLVDFGLARESRDAVQISDGEKLLLLMMRDLFKHIKPKGESDPDFIADMIFGGHYWAASWALPGVFHGHEDDPRDVSFVVDVLDMWNFIERGYEQLSAAEKAKIEKDAAPLGKHVRFMGFDGNDEAELIGIARFLIEKLDRFTAFEDRELNAHMPTRDTYVRMLRVWEPIRRELIGQEMNAEQIAALLVAKRHPDYR